MADVLLARTDGIEGFERHVVLKRIRAEHSRDPHFIKMFLGEARVAANLHHQHIVQVNDIGEANGSYFFAMEYIHGEDVRALLSAASRAKAHLPLGVVVAIGSAAAAGLHHAHERRTPDKRPLNIVHCDVSPSNILVGYDGSIKVVDFGIAKAALRSDDARSGFLKGKASYMSPEQCSGGSVDRRSDVFSLGIVLYELATTTRLFKGPNDAATMDAIQKGRAPLPRVRRPDLPNELAMIIMRALDTDPARRYQTAEELRVALDRFAEAAGLATSTAAVASVLKKMFGERPEPWLELASDPPEPKRSWTELPVSDLSGPHRLSDAALAAGRPPAHARSNTAPPFIAAMQAASVPEQPATETRRRLPPKKVALAAAPVLVVAVGAFAILGMSGGDHGQAAASAATSVGSPAAAAAAQAPSAAPIDPAAPAVRERTVEQPAPTEESVPIVPPPAKQGASLPGRRPAGAVPAGKVAPAPEAVAQPAAPAPAAPGTAEPAAPAAAPAPAPAEVAPAPAPAPASAVAPPAAPAAPPATAITAVPPKPAAPAPEVGLPTIPQVLVNRVAWENARELAKCEGKDTLKGEVTVKFVVGADGRVTQPQIATKMGKPKLAACILRSLARWKFPAQPAGGALGSYTIVFQ
jgi:serine/threonine-protein kinase